MKVLWFQNKYSIKSWILVLLAKDPSQIIWYRNQKLSKTADITPLLMSSYLPHF